MTKKFVCTRTTVEDESQTSKTTIVEGKYVDDLEGNIVDNNMYCGIEVLPDKKGVYILEDPDSESSEGTIYTKPNSLIGITPDKNESINYTHNEFKTVFHVYEGDTRLALFKGETGVIPLEELSIGHKAIFIDLKTDFAKIYAKFEENDGQTTWKFLIEDGIVIFKDYTDQELLTAETNSVFTLDSNDNITLISGNISFPSEVLDSFNENLEEENYSETEQFENEDYSSSKIPKTQQYNDSGCGCVLMTPKKVNISIEPLPINAGLFLTIALISTHNRIFRVLFKKKKKKIQKK